MIVPQQSLLAFNTFGVPGRAEHYAVVESAATLRTVLQTAGRVPELILGGGSNMLLLGDVAGLTVHNRCAGIELVAETEDTVTLAVGGGVVWDDLVQHTLRHDWGGLENLSLIPGTVGAAPVQNIGAYGVEVADVLEQVEAVSLATGELLTFNREDCAFAYRSSIFKTTLKNQVLITRVWLRLSKRHHTLHTSYGVILQTVQDWRIIRPTIQDISRAVIHIRQSKLPDWRKLGNAGSFFKNPIVSVAKVTALQKEYADMPAYPLTDTHAKLAAGWLIDQAGWRGKRMGPVGSYAGQALVLVNYGGATGRQVWALAQAIQQDVARQFGVQLEPEVNVIGK